MKNNVIISSIVVVLLSGVFSFTQTFATVSGTVKSKEGKPIELAIEHLSKSLELNPKYVDAYYQLGLAYLNKGDVEKAKASFEKVIELAPESEKAD